MNKIPLPGGSKAQEVIYNFSQFSKHSENGKIGVHVSVHNKTGELINMFFSYDEAMRLSVGLRASLDAFTL